MSERYALLDLPDGPDDGEARWWLYIDGRNWGGTPYLNDRKMEEGMERGWFSTPADPGIEPDTWLLEIERPSGKQRVGYNRTVATVPEEWGGYPDRRTPEEYDALTDPDSDVYDERVHLIYDVEYRDIPPVREQIEGPWLLLEGAPPEKDGRVWQAKLPHVLKHRHEYRHLFPGELRGFRDAVAAALEQLGGVSAYTHGGGPLSVYVKITLPKHPPLPKWAASPYRSGMTQRERKAAKAAADARTETITRHLDIPVADNIAGENRAQAVKVWDERLAEIVDYVRAITAVLCPTCGGHGFIEPALDHNKEASTT